MKVCTKENTVLSKFFCKSTAAIKHLALRPDYYSHSDFLSALWNTVSSQSEAYFGAGTKLTVLGKTITYKQTNMFSKIKWQTSL